MIKVLLSAYACMPNAGTEPGNGWGWATHLAQRGMEVHVLTAIENRAGIEAHLRGSRIPRLHFCYVDYPTERFKEREGIKYLLWQYSVIKSARVLHQAERFDIAHHVTYGSVHVPSQLWRLGLPVVFGPVGGGQTAPESMLAYFGAHKASEQKRTLLTRLLRYSPWHRIWLGKMSTVLTSNRDTAKLVESLGRKDVEMMFDTALPDDFLASDPRQFENRPDPLKILWVGRMLPRKGLALSLDILAKVHTPAKLTIIGDGIEESVVRNMIAERSLTEIVTWVGRRLPWSEVRAAYMEHDLMLFTSLRDSGGAQLLEAMASGLPVVTLDMHGPGDLVPSGAGIKVEVQNPQQVIKDTAAAIDHYAELPGVERSKMSETGWRFAQGMTYSARAKQAESLYERILASKMAARN